jgi:hypothetical protein
MVKVKKYKVRVLKPIIVEEEKKNISCQDFVHRIISSEEMCVNLGVFMDFHFLQPKKIRVSLATVMLGIEF